MKSSMTRTSHTGMIIHHAKIPLACRQAGVALEKNYKQMKSSMTKTSHTGMIIRNARFHLTTKNIL